VVLPIMFMLIKVPIIKQVPDMGRISIVRRQRERLIPIEPGLFWVAMTMRERSFLCK
jgi:hypothetical protein